MLIRLLFFSLLAGCTQLESPTLSYPSVCMGDKNCERNQNARTMGGMGYPDAALTIMCSDDTFRSALEEQCGDV